MNGTTLLFRQLHPTWIEDGHIASVAFRPFPKDDGLVSTYDGDQISAPDSWTHYTARGLASNGVCAVTVDEAASHDLPARLNVEGHFPEHAVIDFSAHTKSQQKKKATLLTVIAESKGLFFSP